MEITYYPGCTMKTMAKNFEDSAISSFRALGIELKELPRWNCCGTVYSLTSDDLMHHLAPIRNLIRVKEQGADRVLTFCSMCFNTLKRANLMVRENPENRDKLNNFMDREEIDYVGDVEIVHGLEILRDEVGFDKIAEAVKQPLDGLKVAPYYGCMLLRPEEVAIDDAENPAIMENLIEALGAEVIEFPYKNECCGAYQTVNAIDLVAKRTLAITGFAKRAQADVILTSCPLCQFNLDRRQKEVKEQFPEFIEMPVLYFTQLLAVALGLGEEVCRFDLNYINPLTSLGL